MYCKKGAFMVFGFGYGDSFGKIENGINAAIRNWDIAIINADGIKPDWRDAVKAANRLKKEFERLARFAKVHFLLLSEFFIHINQDEIRFGVHSDTVTETNIIDAELLNKLKFLWKHVEQMASEIDPNKLSPTEINDSILVYNEDIKPVFGEITKLVGEEESDLHTLFGQFKNNPSREARILVRDVEAAERELQKIIT